MARKRKSYRLVLSAMFLALALVLPFLTGQIPRLGNALCLIHIPVLLCGFFCGPWLGALIGLCAPLLRFLLFGVPPLVPKGIAMSLELATYGLVAGLLFCALPRKKPYVYVALLGAMTAGRLVWGAARTVFYGLGQSEFGWAAFVSGAFTSAIPGIVLQIVFVPLLVFSLEKYTAAPSS